MKGGWTERAVAFGGRAGSILLFLAIWWGVSLGNAHLWKAFNPMLLPSPLEVIQAGIDEIQSGALQRNILASLARVLQGFALAGVLGVAVGVAVGSWRPLERLVEPLIELLRPIPPLAFLPMMVLWFGIGEISKIAFIAYAAFFPIFTTTLEGIRYVDPVLVRAAASLGATRGEMFRYVILPAATPSIITGLRLGFGLSFFVIVAAEFIAADSGLGYMINDARTFFMVSHMFLGALVIGIIGFVVNIGLRQVERRLLRWRGAV
ncbi:Taurine transport system permease protein TauC [Rhodovastum atsumiense]|uniref:ABC transporter permease n=1 Tax=Rhodovastum atsumiense TaxID=504468 RepID=A0A5M6IIX8_9PROT|nr:ABC transporter permease [Rhodovastum atsumiense]KAA5608204.1 ABC transporter permease [Rhodovastum atsumiense]CAH2602283.1 Taurine transport system permease protein TauC [Rhodovastum atsumiense]